MMIPHFANQFAAFLRDELCLPIPSWSRERLHFFVLGVLVAGSIVLRQIASAQAS